MDSRPLRPRPSENSVPSLHSRHKSTGNLAGMASTSAAFGFQRPAKRSAFGDVTNMSRISAGGRDDSKVGLKSQPIAPLPGRANKENAALPKDGILRPIARPAGALKPRASNESRPVDAAIRLVHQDQQHRISDSVALPLPLPSVPEQRASLSHARFDSLPLQPRHYKSQPQLRQPQPNLRKTQSRQFDRSDRLPLESIKLTETVPEVPESPELPEAREDTATALAPLEAVLSQEMQPQESGDTVYLDSLCYPVAESQPGVNHAVDYNQIAPELHQDAPTKASSVLHESSYPALSEPEEYWDEDDEDYDDQDQAYTTAHSFRSRDMTMGNVTTVLAPKQTARVQRELEEARAVVEETMTPEEFEEEAWDVSMVAEYGEDIFEYLRELEIKMLPNPHYMETQTEVHWSMRSVLMDWLVQVHERFGLLPETLFLTVNYIDRFLSHKIVSMGKLQLVGATAILLASKYEEINCPSLDEIVYMVDKAYPAEEILKAERFMLSILNFELGWPGPMSFLRRVSKADDYDLDTRTLAKYFLELTIMDERFVATPPSFLAAGAHCLSRLILNKGDWTKHHVHYSGYTWSQLKPLVSMLIECCEHPKLHHIAVFEKYCSKKFKEAALIVQDALDAGFVLPQQSTPVRSSEPPVVPSAMLDHSSYPAGVLTSY